MIPYMGVSENNGTPQIIHFNRVFHYKPSIFGGTTILGNPHIQPIPRGPLITAHWKPSKLDYPSSWSSVIAQLSNHSAASLAVTFAKKLKQYLQYQRLNKMLCWLMGYVYFSYLPKWYQLENVDTLGGTNLKFVPPTIRRINHYGL